MSEETEKKTTRNVENFYIASNGAKASRPQPDVVAVSKKFKSGHEEIIHLKDLTDEIFRQCAAFGLQQVGQNAYGAAKGDDERLEKLQDRWDTLREGNWASERQDGPRVGDLIEAVKQVVTESGKTVTDEWIADLKAKLEAKEITAADLKENPQINAKLDAIRAKRAQERAEKSAAAASESQGDLSTLLGL